jgi:hypothetical protein
MSHPYLITIHIAYHPQNLCPKISALLKISHISAFSFDKLDFLYMPTYSRPGSNVFYALRYGNEITALRLAIVNSVKPCGQRSSTNFTYYMWKTFVYYFTNYVMVVLPSRTSGNKILYTRYYKAEIAGENSRTFKMCICNIWDLLMSYNVGCKKPDPCSCIIFKTVKLSVFISCNYTILHVIISYISFNA